MRHKAPIHPAMTYPQRPSGLPCKDNRRKANRSHIFIVPALRGLFCLRIVERAEHKKENVKINKVEGEETKKLIYLYVNNRK